jgi:superfamily II DNA or RNA helicase
MAEELRPYQQKIINEAFESVNEEINSVLLQMPTGTGKTHVFAEIVRKWTREYEPNKKVLIIAHRVELIDQIISRLLRFGVIGSPIFGGKVQDPNYQVQVAMIQSLKKTERLPSNISLLIIDEAHHSTAKSYKKLIQHYRAKNDKLKIIGLTATPYRLSGDGFSQIFDKLITSDQIKDFIHNGFLSQIRHFAASKIDLSEVALGFDRDYLESDLESIVRNDVLLAELVESYKIHASGKKAIVFSLNKAHSKDIVDRYMQNNIQAAYIDSDTDSEERSKLVQKFREGEIQVLCNVNIFTEGFDCPDVEVVQLARPTKSLSLYLQQVGRVMRPSPEKQYGIILDNACLWEEHGMVTQPFTWQLEYNLEEENAKSKQKKRKIKSQIEKLPYEIKGVELTELLNDVEIDDDIENDSQDTEVEEVNWIMNNLRFDVEINPIIESYDPIRISKLRSKLKISDREILSCLQKTHRHYYSDINSKLSGIENYYVQKWVETSETYNQLILSNKEILIVFQNVADYIQQIRNSILDQNDQWVEILQSIIEKNGKLNCIPNVSDEFLFRLLGIPFDENNPIYNSALSIINFEIMWSRRMIYEFNLSKFKSKISDFKTDYSIFKWIEINGITEITPVIINTLILKNNISAYSPYVYDRSFNGNEIANKRISEINKFIDKRLTPIGNACGLNELVWPKIDLTFGK